MKVGIFSSRPNGLESRPKRRCRSAFAAVQLSISGDALMLRKFTSFLCVGLISVAFVGCGDTADDTSSTADDTAASTDDGAEGEDEGGEAE